VPFPAWSGRDGQSSLRIARPAPKPTGPACRQPSPTCERAMC
jgi:hypothetical protein